MLPKDAQLVVPFKCQKHATEHTALFQDTADRCAGVVRPCPRVPAGGLGRASRTRGNSFPSPDSASSLFLATRCPRGKVAAGVPCRILCCELRGNSHGRVNKGPGEPAQCCVSACECPCVCTCVCPYACAWVCARVCMSVCAVHPCMRPCVHARVWTWACPCVSPCAHVLACVCPLMHVCVPMCMPMCACLCVSPHAHVHAHVWTCACSCVSSRARVSPHAHVCLCVCPCACVCTCGLQHRTEWGRQTQGAQVRGSGREAEGGALMPEPDTTGAGLRCRPHHNGLGGRVQDHVRAEHRALLCSGRGCRCHRCHSPSTASHTPSRHLGGGSVCSVLPSPAPRHHASHLLLPRHTPGPGEHPAACSQGCSCHLPLRCQAPWGALLPGLLPSPAGLSPLHSTCCRASIPSPQILEEPLWSRQGAQRELAPTPPPQTLPERVGAQPKGRFPLAHLLPFIMTLKIIGPSLGPDLN